MAYTRTFRKDGEVLYLGENAYRILGIAGYGGSSVVYYAAYRDGLNTDQEHHVLIKELYPYDPRGHIYRNEEGEICWTEEAGQKIERSRKCFRLGNQVNLELLEKLPSQISGNHNSYEAYGTYYSVLTVHGGVILEELLSGEEPAKTLRQAAVITIKILDALRGLHQNGLLHLDISPDNILLLPEQAMLIDYNSVLRRSDIEACEFLFAGKAGYAAPEVLEEDVSSIDYSSDLYSVCAVFYRMLTKDGMTDREMDPRHMQKKLCSGLEIFCGEPQSAVSKAIQILLRGLQVLSRKRYADIDSLKRDLEELVERIDGKGISNSALWESSRTLYRRTGDMDHVYLPQNISISDFGEVTLRELYDYLKEGHNVLLKGPGGMGKTSLLKELWGMHVESYRANAPVVYYISLKDYQETQGESCFIRKYFLRQLCFSEGQPDTEDALHELERIFDQRAGLDAGVILLLDGLNEAGSNREKLLREIEGLGDKPGVGVLVTERTEEVLEYGLTMFQSAQLLPLPPQTVRNELEKYGIPLPEKTNLRELLSNPMMLDLYKSIISMEKDNRTHVASDRSIRSADDLVRLYMENLCTTQLRIDAGNESMQLCHKYILVHLLPAIALAMTRKKRTLLSFDQMYQILRQNYGNLRKIGFGKKFKDYLGKSRMMLGSLSEMEWFDFAVAEQLDGNLGLVTKNSNGYYGLIHDDFQHYLAKCGRDNEKRLHSLRLPVAIGLTVCLAALDFVGIGRILPGKGHDPAAGAVTEYYHDIKEVYDVPKGIHTVTEDDLPQMSSYWAIRTNESKTIFGKRFTKGLGTGSFLWATDVADIEIFYDDPLYYNGETTYRSADILSSSGYVTYSYGKDFYESAEGAYRVISCTGSESPDNLPFGNVNAYYEDYGELGKDIVRIKEYYTQEGYIHYNMFLNSFTDADSYSKDENGISGLEFEYNELGIRTAQYYLDQDRKRVSRQGVHKVEYVYDESGNLVESTYRDEENSLVQGREGWARVKLSYDQWHNRTGLWFYDRAGNPAKGPEGAEHLEFVFNKGNVTNVSYFDGNGNLQKNTNGYAVEERFYDHGYSVRQRFLDKTGKPCKHAFGFGERTLELGYDEETDTYKPLTVRYLDLDGSMCMNANGFAGICYEYTQDGILCRITMIDVQEKPCSSSDGYAVIEGKDPIEDGGFRWIICYDENGREVERMDSTTYDGIYLKWR